MPLVNLDQQYLQGELYKKLQAVLTKLELLQTRLGIIACRAKI